jgi:hypothetical protein
MTKEEVIAAVQECATKLGHAPSMAEFRKATTLGKGQVRKHFGTFGQLLEASGLEARGSGHMVEMKALFADWAGIVRRLKKCPTLADYELHSKYSPRPLVRRFGLWVNVPTGMLEYAKKEGLGGGLGRRAGDSYGGCESGREPVTDVGTAESGAKSAGDA